MPGVLKVKLLDGTWVPIGAGQVSGGGGGIDPTILNAKGDLIVATANDTPGILTLGTNAQVLTVDTATATGTKWAGAPAPTLALDQWLTWGGVNTMRRITAGGIALETGASQAVTIAGTSGFSQLQVGAGGTLDTYVDAYSLAPGMPNLRLRRGTLTFTSGIGTDDVWRFAKDVAPLAANQIMSVPSTNAAITFHIPVVLPIRTVTNATLADVATATFKGRTQSGTGVPEDLTVTQATAMLNVFTGALKGLVPSGGSGTTFLRGDATWQTVSGGGAPTDAEYLVAATHGSLSAEKLLTATAPLVFTPATAVLSANAYTGGSGTGVVPTGGTASTYLRGDGTWNTPSGSGASTSAPYVTWQVDAGLTNDKVLAAGTGLSLTDATFSVATNGISNVMLATMATARFKGRIAGTTGDPEDLTGTQATTLLDAFAGAAKGLVPTGSTNDASKYLNGQGGWTVPAGGGGGAPTTAEYALTAADGALTNGHVMTTSPTIGVAPYAGGVQFNLLSGSVGNGHLVNRTGPSVMGRMIASSGAVSDIAASADGQYLQRTGGGLAFAAPPVFAGTVAGFVPGTSGGSTTTYLRGDGTWQTPPGGGGSVVHRVSIWPGRPDDTGRAFFTPYSVYAANDLYRREVGVLLDVTGTQAHGFYGTAHVPNDYAGAAEIIVVWTAPVATTGNVRSRFSYRAVGGDNTESLDQTTHQEQVTVVDAAPGAINRRMETSFTLTAANLEAADTLQWLYERWDDGSALDTMADVVLIHDIFLEYTT